MEYKENLIILINYLMDNYFFILEANTIKTLKNNGFFKVDFTLKLNNDHIFITNETGAIELEELWQDNPQITSYDNISKYMRVWDCEYAVNCIKKYCNDNNIDLKKVLI